MEVLESKTPDLSVASSRKQIEDELFSKKF